jgi:hypothetical protein
VCVQSRIVRSIEIVVVTAAITMCPATAKSQPPATGGDQPNRVVIEYVRPRNADFGDFYESLKRYDALEKIQQILSPLRLSKLLEVRT